MNRGSLKRRLLRKTPILSRLATSLDALETENQTLRDRLAPVLGHGLEAIVEVTLERQGAEHLSAFEQRAVIEAPVQQCYRVSPGPDFVLMLWVAEMTDYHALVQRLFTQDANVRNVKTFFATHRAKFEPAVTLRPSTAPAP